MRDPFLVDECLTPDRVRLAHARGHAASHVVHRGFAGATDRRIAAVAIREGSVLVTNNARDFLTIYAREPLHPGLVVVMPGGLVAEVQVRLFSIVLDAIDSAGDLLNTLVEVHVDGRVDLRPWPPSAG